MELKKFTDADGAAIYINPEHVVAVYPANRRDTNVMISCVNGSVYSVREGQETVARELDPHHSITENNRG